MVNQTDMFLQQLRLAQETNFLKPFAAKVDFCRHLE